MKTQNAIKKLQNQGFKVEQKDNLISGWMGEHRVSFYDQQGSITCIFTDCQFSRDTRDSMTDYFPETYHDNITRAINFVKRKLEQKAGA